MLILDDIYCQDQNDPTIPSKSCPPARGRIVIPAWRTDGSSVRWQCVTPFRSRSPWGSFNTSELKSFSIGTSAEFFVHRKLLFIKAMSNKYATMKQRLLSSSNTSTTLLTPFGSRVSREDLMWKTGYLLLSFTSVPTMLEHLVHLPSRGQPKQLRFLSCQPLTPKVLPS